MNKLNPSAYPWQEVDYHESAQQQRTVIHDHHQGMSLMDYFAGLAMQAELSIQDENYALNGKDAAKMAYDVAEAMLKERQKRMNHNCTMCDGSGTVNGDPFVTEKNCCPLCTGTGLIEKTE